MVLKKRIFICCEKNLFAGVNIVYSLNVNIISKILTPDGENNLKVILVIKEDSFKRCVQELCLKPSVGGTTWSWHEMQWHANLI